MIDRNVSSYYAMLIEHLERSRIFRCSSFIMGHR